MPMKTYQLKRQQYTPEGVSGFLMDGDKKLCCTWELPWLDNANGKSCIPAGAYKVVRHRFETPGHTKSGWRLLNVPGREGILIHRGNTVEDIEGCILVGANFGMLPGSKTKKIRPGVLSSKVTVDRLRKVLPVEFMLEVM
jgi:hypothetical protein